MATFKIMERLASRGHELFLITGLRPGEKQHLDEVKYFCTVLDAIEIPWSRGEVAKAVIQWIFRAGRGGLTFRSKCALAIDKLSKQIHFDIIQVEHTELGDCIKGPMDVPTIIDAHDVILKPALREYNLATGMRKAVKYIKFRMVKRKEISTYERFTEVFVRSEFDRNLLLSYRGDLNVYILRGYARIEDFSGKAGNREPGTLLYVGAMDRTANIDAIRYFYEKVFPLVKREVPAAKLTIVGNKPPEEITRIGREDKDVIVTGFVEDIKPYYLKASVFVAPLFVGGGLIQKILDALAAGIPVVTTSVGNEGIDAVPDKDILIADDAEDFAKKVILLLKDNGLSQSISENGRAFVQDKFQWDTVIQKLEDEYKRLIA
jgi:glycosyltransferase involved in cell wall biosynthesis